MDLLTEKEAQELIDWAKEEVKVRISDFIQEEHLLDLTPEAQEERYYEALSEELDCVYMYIIRNGQLSDCCYPDFWQGEGYENPCSAIELHGVASSSPQELVEEVDEQTWDQNELLEAEEEEDVQV